MDRWSVAMPVAGMMVSLIVMPRVADLSRVVEELYSGWISAGLGFWREMPTQEIISSILPAVSHVSASCPGYVAGNITRSATGLSADLVLGGKACNVYGRDLHNLKLAVRCETKSRLHVQIFDPELNVYQLPESVLPRPDGSIPCDQSDLEISVSEQPFSFSVRRKSNDEIIFDTSKSPLVFEDQYWNVRTVLPPEPNLYGLGEHTDPLRLNTTHYTRTLWNRDSSDTPEGENLYGSHPVYFENRIRSNATHAVALLNSNGMDVKIHKTARDGQYLEFNVLGGIVDLQFLSGPDPLDVARQYSELVGKAIMMPYWGLGFHQCRFGYKDISEVIEVVRKHSEASIPLETMWTDIDYMDAHKVFTLSSKFPLDKMRDFIDDLHHNNQHYILMVDPAVAYQDYSAFNRGKEADIFLKNSSGDPYQGVVWPGVTAYPDWFNSDTQAYWNREFEEFFDAENGVDIDALWIDMNEPSNFCEYPCLDPKARADERLIKTQKSPPLPGLGVKNAEEIHHFEAGQMKGLPGRDLINPPYKINNDFGILSNLSANTSVIHANGLAMYDTHNLYGTMMSAASHKAMLARRPKRRAMVITRSTFMGAGSQVGHWLGDNRSTWHHYRQSIRHMLQFTSIFQMPMVGADVCGFSGDTTVRLCTRWARLGGFYPFMRNHNVDHAKSQEFYLWPEVTEAARKAIDLRYRLLDYIYSAMYLQTTNGTPLITPMWMFYPQDPEAANIDLQFFYGPALLVSPVTEENTMDVSIYLPKDDFFDFRTLQPVTGRGGHLTLRDIGDAEIPIHIRGGNIVPMRTASANTTTQLRTEDFELLVAPDQDERARGFLYLDDGDSLVQEATSKIWFEYDGGVLTMDGTFAYDVGPVKIVKAILLGQKGAEQGHSSLTTELDWPLTEAVSSKIA